MKIIKGAAKAEIHWTARQLVEYVEDGIPQVRSIQIHLLRI